MNNWMQLILPTICFCLGLSGIVKYVFYKNSTSPLGVMTILYYLGVTVFGVLFLLTNQLLTLDLSQKISNTLIFLSCGIYLTSVLLLIIPNWTDKKIKTLFRIPIICVLLGNYLAEDNLFYFIGMLELIIIGIGFNFKEKNQYITRVQRKLLFLFPILIAMVFMRELQLYFCYLIFSAGLKNTTLNGLVIKNIIYKNQKLEENV